MERKSLNYLRWGVLFTFLNFSVGRLNLLPDFVGMLLFYASVGSHEQPTGIEEKIKPLLLVLAADYFIHWVWQFENGVEALLALVIQIYVLFVFFGEVAGRIRVEQPDRARQIEKLRVCNVLLQSFVFLVSPYKIEALKVWIVIAAVGICMALMVVLFQIQPQETEAA